MTGFAAIQSYNGWAMAMAGAAIVMTGLIVLASIIGLFPKLVAIIEKKKEKPQSSKTPDTPKVDVSVSEPPHVFPSDPKALAQIYAPIVEPLGTEFDLAKLYAEARKQEFPHPHISLRTLQDAGILLAVGEGVFRWNNQS